MLKFVYQYYISYFNSFMTRTVFYVIGTFVMAELSNLNFQRRIGELAKHHDGAC